MKKIRIAIATKNTEKILGIQSAFLRFLRINEEELEVITCVVPSGVSEQPFNEETYKGAINRLENLKGCVEKADFYVSCEAGIEEFFGKYFNVQVVCISNNKKMLMGKSSAFNIPAEDIEEIRESTLHIYLKKKGLRSTKKLIGKTRAQLVEEATLIALKSQKLF